MEWDQNQQFGWIDGDEVLVHRIQEVVPQKFELLVVIVQVMEKVDKSLVECLDWRCEQ